MRKLACFCVLGLLIAGLSDPVSAQSKKAADLIKKLSDKNPMARQSAAEDLAELADIKIVDAKAALPALTEALKDPEPGVRNAVVAALGKIEPEKFPALLMETLKKEKDGVVLIGAANALGQLGPEAKATLPALYEAFKASPQETPKVTKAPPQPNPMPTDPPAVRRAILAAVARIEPDIKVRMPFMIEALKPEKDPGVQQNLINGLGQIGPPAKDAIPAILEIQKASLADAAKIGPKDNRDLDPQGVRRTILGALSRIDPDPKELVPILTNALKSDRDGQVRNQAITLLSQMGVPAKPAIPTMLEVHKSITGPGDPQGLRRAIVVAIGRIETDPKESVPLYTQVLKVERDPAARLAGVQAIGNIGPPAKTAFATLVDVMKTSPPQVKGANDPQGLRRSVIEALAKIEPEPKEFVPVLITTLKQDRDPAVKSAAIASLAKLGSDAKPAAQALAELVKTAKTDADKALAKEASDALEKIGK